MSLSQKAWLATRPTRDTVALRPRLATKTHTGAQCDEIMKSQQKGNIYNLHHKIVHHAYHKQVLWNIEV